MPSWLLLLLLFPAICAGIGYVTNVLAVKMIFRPHRRINVLGVGIQGVLPKHQEHFARLLAGIITRDFVNTGDLVEALARPDFVDRVEALARDMAPDIIAAVREAVPADKQALLNDAMLSMATEQIIAQARARTPDIVQALKKRANEALDLEDVICEKVLGWGPGGLERVIYAVSKRELDFIEYYGAIFGFAIGLLQYGVLQLLGNMALPIVGALVGTITNWLAIQMLFYPREPRLFFGFFRYQGMFPKRQLEMAAKIGAIAAEELIIPEEVFNELTARLIPSLIEPAILEIAETTLRAEVPQLFQVVDALVPETARPELRRILADGAPPHLARARQAMVTAAVDTLDVHTMLRERLAALNKSEFEQLIRGLFEREEVYLIIYGGLLGGLIGGLQLLLVGWIG